jgi:TPR repeat protein
MDLVKLRQAAENGSVPSQTLLGICFLEGIEVEADFAEAFRLLSLASSRGASRAILNLAKMYANGIGVPQDTSEAIRLYQRAAERGEFLAQVALGRIYAQGSGVARDEQAALKWYSIAAAREATVVDCDELNEAKAFVSAKSEAGDE